MPGVGETEMSVDHSKLTENFSEHTELDFAQEVICQRLEPLSSATLLSRMNTPGETLVWLLLFNAQIGPIDFVA